MTKRPLRLLLADHAATCAGIRMALDVEVCAEVSHAAQAIRAAKHEQPDVCLLARNMCGDGLSVVTAISRAAPHAAIVVLAEHDDADDLLDALRAGAIGYLPGPLDGECLRRVIEAVTRNEAIVPRSMVLQLTLELRGNRDGLTAREAQISGLLRRGHTTAEIARRLDISSITVRRHISETVHKLGLEDRAGLTGRSQQPQQPLRTAISSRSATGRDATADPNGSAIRRSSLDTTRHTAVPSVVTNDPVATPRPVRVPLG